MKKDDSVYIRHILDAISRIERYVSGVEEKEFQNNEMMQDAIIRQIEIIGEASKKLSSDTKDAYKDIEWKDIAGMRDKLIHDYFGVDLQSVWDTATIDIPKLKQSLSGQ